MLLIVFVEALVILTVTEGVGAEVVHQVVLELAFVRPPIRPLLHSHAVNHVLVPVPLVERAICPVVLPKALLQSPVVET